MNIIITMAGMGSRFLREGYILPKYKIMAGGKTMFEWALSSLDNFKSHHFTFICLKEHDPKEFIRDRTQAIKNKEIVMLDNVTDGQATTVLKGSVGLDDRDPVLIHNIDTFVDPSELRQDMIQGDGWIPYFIAEGSNWSFVKVRRGVVTAIAEKQRISDKATVGIYYFSSLHLFKRCYSEYYKGLSQGERYIAPIYNNIIRHGNVHGHLVRKVRVMGTPEEVRIFENTGVRARP